MRYEKTANFKPPQRFYIFMRRTTISHFSFLISHSIEVFKRNQGASRPTGEPCTLHPIHL